MQKLFTYGTLQHQDIQEDIFGRILKGTPETLVGYIVNTIKIEEEFGMIDYPIIVETENPEDIILQRCAWGIYKESRCPGYNPKGY